MIGNLLLGSRQATRGVMRFEADILRFPKGVHTGGNRSKLDARSNRPWSFDLRRFAAIRMDRSSNLDLRRTFCVFLRESIREAIVLSWMRDRTGPGRLT